MNNNLHLLKLFLIKFLHLHLIYFLLCHAQSNALGHRWTNQEQTAFVQKEG